MCLVYVLTKMLVNNDIEKNMICCHECILLSNATSIVEILWMKDEWVNPFTHVNERGWVSDCVSWVCLCHISDNLLVNRILDGRTDGHTRFSAETLNPDTPKRIPWQWGIPITPSDTHTPSSQNPPKSSPITLRF
jgi:hypothetical protein